VRKQVRSAEFREYLALQVLHSF